MFVTIVIITLALESIVLVFETKLEDIQNLLYPTALMAVAVLALIGLGAFQRLSAEGGSNLIGADEGADVLACAAKIALRKAVIDLFFEIFG